MSVKSDSFVPPFTDWEGWFSLDIRPIYNRWISVANYGLHIRQQDLDSDDGQEVCSSESCIGPPLSILLPDSNTYSACSYQNIAVRLEPFSAYGWNRYLDWNTLLYQWR